MIKMKSNCRLKSILKDMSFHFIGLFLLSFIVLCFAQGTRPNFSSGQSIVPRGFQHFSPISQNFFAPRNTGRLGTAAAVQNPQFAFFPPQKTENFARPAFIGLGLSPSSPPVSPSQPQPQVKSKGGEVQYEYYDEPEEEIIYQYGTDTNNDAKDTKTQQPPVTAPGREISTGQYSRFHGQPQAFTTANLGTKSTLRSAQGGGFLRESSPSQQRYIAFEEPEQPLLLNGRSVHQSSRGSNSVNIRPHLGLLRSSTPLISTTSATTSTTTTSTTARTTTPTDRTRIVNRKKNNNVRKPVAPVVPSRSRFTSSRSTTPSSKKPQELVQTASSTYTPDIRPVTPATISDHAVKRKSGEKKEERASGSGEEYSVEYVEYPESPEEDGNAPGTKSGGSFDYYEVSEETAKAILKEQKAKLEEKAGPKTSATSTTPGTTSTTTVGTTPRSVQHKSKVVVSVSTTKTISGSVERSTKVVTPSTSTTTTSTTTQPPTTKRTTTTTTERTPTPTTERDQLPAGAETSPEYYEEEYSYHENPHKSSTSTSVSSSSSISGPSKEPFHEEDEPEKDTEEEEEEEHDNEEKVHLKYPQPRKLPEKKEFVHNRFQTLVDFGDLESEPRIPLVGSNHQEEEQEHEVPSSTSTTTKKPPPSITKAPKIFPEIKFTEIPPDLLPPGFTLAPTQPSTTSTTTSRTITTTTTAPSTTTTKKPSGPGIVPINFDEIPSFLLPKGYKPLATQATEATTTTTSTTTTVAPSTSKPPVSFDSIPLNLLPKGYKPPEYSSVTTSATASPSTTTEGTKDPLQAILSKIKFQEIAIPALVPKGYEKPAEENIPANLLPPGYKPPPVETPEIPANLLPPGFKPGGPSTTIPSSSTNKPNAPVFPTRPPSAKGGLVFPTKPGGFRVARPTTTERAKADTPPPPKVAIAGGWPIRKTTQFTGWPTSSTTPMPPTSSTTTTTTTTEKTTTTTTTTTTPPPPKRSPAGVCPHDICRMEATIRITGGIKWKPEFADINTEEYKHLDLTVRRELDGAYRASGLAPWYKRVQIEGFNQGSVLVDYFVELEGVDRELTTSDVVKVFHKSLLDSDPGDELPQETEAPAALRLGRFNIDPRYTDFKVANPKTGKASAQPEPLIPQWGIAVIVIGMVSLLFLLILGVIVIVSRYKASKKKNTVSLTQEMLNEFNKSHMAVSGGGGLDNYGADDLYNMDDVWNDKQAERTDRTFDRRPTKRSQGGSTKGGGGGNYNIYDSWKTEWNGYYYNGHYYGDSGYAPSRRRVDYDTNF